MQAIILAAGKSTRFGFGKTKLLEPICGQSMILYPVYLFESLGMPFTFVVGYQKEEIQSCVQAAVTYPVSFVVQEEQRGTGHALMCTRDTWRERTILIINGDMPLITKDVIDALVKNHTETGAVISFITSHYSDAASSGYGRVIQKKGGIEIVEARHLTEDSITECCINAGIYLIDKTFLDQAIDALGENELTHEFYITDLVKMASDVGYVVSTVSVLFDVIRGVNTLQELWAVEHIQRSALIKYWMERGVRFLMPQYVHIDNKVVIGAGTFIGSGVQIRGTTAIGNNCTIEAFTLLDNVTVGDNVTIFSHSVISDSYIKDHTYVGPFAHVHNCSTLESMSVVGNFVEVKNSVIGEHTKAKHLSYLGDACLGKKVNIGAGTITCNYDGVQKQSTVIEDNVFIGSNNTLVAPLFIHKNSFTAAGSTITKNVPEYTLAFGRSHQINKEGYMYTHDILSRQELSGQKSREYTQDGKGEVSSADISTDIPTESRAESCTDSRAESCTESFKGATRMDFDTSSWYLD